MLGIRDATQHLIAKQARFCHFTNTYEVGISCSRSTKEPPQEVSTAITVGQSTLAMFLTGSFAATANSAWQMPSASTAKQLSAVVLRAALAAAANAAC